LNLNFVDFMVLGLRIFAALRIAALHFLGSIVVASVAAIVVFDFWYPFPYHELSGGRELFLLVVSVDIVCGPLLTLVLFNPAKLRAALLRDLGLVALIQLGALGYGLSTVWLARPLFLVQEVERFKVIAAPDVSAEALASLPVELQPHWLSGPITVAIRAPRDEDEREKVLFASVQGGRDYAQRPDFYLPYEGAAALKSLNRAKPLAAFLQKYPDQRSAAQGLLEKAGFTLESARYLPVIARQDWIVLLDGKGMVVGFLKGDGF
jgi:hypothetical protein